MTKGITAFAVSVFGFSFGLVKWTKVGLDNVNRDVGVQFTKHTTHHSRNSVGRFYAPISKRGRGMTDFR